MTNLEAVQELYRAFRARDGEALRRVAAPDLMWEQQAGFPGGATWRGAEAVLQGVFAGNDARWENFKFAIAEYLDAGEQIIVLGTYSGTHRETGRAFRADGAHIYTVQNGLITRFRQYTDTKIIWDATQSL